MDFLSNASEQPEMLLKLARAGDSKALGRLLELYRNFLRLLARTQIGADLRVRMDSSDLVPESLREAHRGFPQFLGTTEKELLAWLRRILARNVADQVKKHKALRRNWERQES